MWLSTIQMRTSLLSGATPWMSSSVGLSGLPLWWMWFPYTTISVPVGSSADELLPGE